MKLIQSLFFIILLVVGVYFIVELISANDEHFIKKTYQRTSIAASDSSMTIDSTSNTVDQVMINIPFSKPGSEGMKVWVFFILILTSGLILGFFISLVNIFSQRRKIMHQRSELKKMKSELDTLRNQNIDDNLVLSDDFEDDQNILID